MALGQCNPQSKLLWHLDRVNQWDKTGKVSPILFEIDPTNKCNHNCPWCSFAQWRSENQDSICIDALKKLLDDLKKMGVLAINWTGGGEPLMNPATIEAIQYAKSIGFDQGIFTNGALINEEKANILAKNMTWVRISLDGYSPEVYAKSHGTSTNSFNKVIENVRRLSSIEGRCTVGIGYIINEDNYKGIYDIALLARGTGVDYIQFKPEIRRPGKEQINSNLLKDIVLPECLKAEKLSTDKFNVMVTTYRFNDVMSPETNYGRKYEKCYSHNFQGAIAADKKVYICDHHKGEERYEIGDLNKEGIDRIWESEKRARVIAYLDSTRLEQCQACCRNHELNKFLWHIKNKDERMHPNHV